MKTYKNLLNIPFQLAKLCSQLRVTCSFYARTFPFRLANLLYLWILWILRGALSLAFANHFLYHYYFRRVAFIDVRSCGWLNLWRW